MKKYQTEFKLKVVKSFLAGDDDPEDWLINFKIFVSGFGA
jgi:hypothetical protein